MIPQVDKNLFILYLVSVGGRSSNKKLREYLCWDETRFNSVKKLLMTRNIIISGRGRGGSVMITDIEQSRLMVRLKKLLNLHPTAMFSVLHQPHTVYEEPIAVSGKEWSRSVPSPTAGTSVDAARTGTIPMIDQDLLARILVDTSSVSALLADLFAYAEETPAAPVPCKAVPDASPAGLSPYQGLDDRHSSLLAFVVGQGGCVSLEVFQAAARKLQLLPGAAMEIINDWGFANQHEAVLEEHGDEVTLPQHLLSSLSKD